MSDTRIVGARTAVPHLVLAVCGLMVVLPVLYEWMERNRPAPAGAVTETKEREMIELKT